IDVRIRNLGPDPLADGAPIRVLIGTAEGLGRVHLADDRDALAPGAFAFAQLRLDTEVPALPGDRFVIRRPSPEQTLGGGEVIDPWAPRMKRRDVERARRQLERLARGDATVFLERAG